MQINIPTSLKDIKLSQFVAFEKSDKTDDDYIIHLCDFANPKLIPVKEYNEIVSLLKEVMQSDVEFSKIFKHEGIEFGFIPNLDLISANEFMHIDEFIKSPDTYHKALAVLYRPVTKRKKNWFKRGSHDLYDILPYNENKTFEELMNNVSCVYYLGAMVFFYNLGNDLLKYMQDYSILLESKIKKKPTSTKSGGGTLV
jgi:hypothetical protein